MKHIEFHGDKGGNIYDYLGKIVMYTLDGIELELSTNKVRPVVAAKIDIPKFEKHHRDIGVLEPLNILENNSLFSLRIMLVNLTLVIIELFLPKTCLYTK
ncbi:hypothetical protein [Escherichia coli]|uniref:hypothetical protein n=1 Tax=Escherichia coli TaxID=562 RepID=UPI0003EE64BE|nr:hypothetical protein [Escherichia coli]